jgi:DNA-binding response OmpR family regulator
VAARILIVEDDEATRYAITRALVTEGFAVDSAADGQEGLAAARKPEEYDVIVLAWTLPKLSGIDLCRTLRAESPVPIIMLTAKGTEVDRVLGLELGADDYMVKPFSTKELVSRVRALIRRQRLERERGTAPCAPSLTILSVRSSCRLSARRSCMSTWIVSNRNCPIFRMGMRSSVIKRPGASRSSALHARTRARSRRPSSPSSSPPRG